MAEQKTTRKVKTEYKVIESQETPGQWRVEAVKPDGESEICSTIFFGPDARSRAEDYADWRAESEETEPSEADLNISWGAFVERQRIAKFLRDSADHQAKQGNSDETAALLRAAFDVLTGNHQEPPASSSSPTATLVPANDSSDEAHARQDSQGNSHHVEDTTERSGYHPHHGHERVGIAHSERDEQAHQSRTTVTTGKSDKR